jgi:hypothetical protein
VFNGLLEGGPSFVAGKLGQAIDGNGSSQDVDLGTDLGLAPVGEMTVACWYYPDTVASNYAIVARSTNNTGTMAWSLLTVGGNLSFWITNTSGTYVNLQSAGVVVGAWHHFIATYDKAFLRAYKNNSLMSGTIAQTGDQRRQAGYHTIIAAQHSTNGSDRTLYNPNKIDEVAIWNRVLADSERADLYNSGDGLPWGSVCVGVGNAMSDSLLVDCLLPAVSNYFRQSRPRSSARDLTAPWYPPLKDFTEGAARMYENILLCSADLRLLMKEARPIWHAKNVGVGTGIMLKRGP